MTCENCEHLKNEVWPILYENDSWRAILYGGSQEYLGKSILTCKQHVPTLGKLSEAQWNDLREAIAWYEGRVTKAFTPTHYNWQCLMNNAAGRHEQTHVHWLLRLGMKRELNLTVMCLSILAGHDHLKKYLQRHLVPKNYSGSQA